MKKRKIGLQKDVSTIFDGVPVPKADGIVESSDAAVPGNPDYNGGKPFGPSHLVSVVPEVDEVPCLSPPIPAPTEESEIEPEVESKVESEIESEIKPEVEPEIESKVESEVESKVEPELTSQAKPAIKPVAKPVIKPVIKPAKKVPWQQVLEKIKDKFFASKSGVDPKKQVAMVILVPVLFGILFFVFKPILFKPSRKPSGSASDELTNAVVAFGGEIDWQIPALYPRTLRDPMRFGSVTTEQDATASLEVKGILYSRSNPTAVIGSRIVREGGKVLKATVVKINKDSVEFEMNGKRWTQKVQE